ncbi:expressed unknown protein [Seminavis robusta]|uniref:Uncharacterized protein n=1 Tax=Seminavis robusta TaxID=568900 RepID=A0A9N8DTN0_9STRA|nr:expressed unknown protein [Seminavis robusta]|eukprot:Sro334_g119900.1 n/a (145) ;mRNA; r:61431-62141
MNGSHCVTHIKLSRNSIQFWPLLRKTQKFDCVPNRILSLLKFIAIQSYTSNMQRFLFTFLLLVSAVASFTPDAAFKRSQVNLSFGNEDQKNVFVYTQSTNDKRRRSAFVSMTDNLRKSVTGPPSFEDYMTIRRRAMSEVTEEEQ